MTNVITRVFADPARARHARDRILFHRVPSRACALITAQAGPDLLARIARAGVHESAIARCAAWVREGHTLLVVRTTYKPLTAATIVREVLDRCDTIDTGDMIDDHFEPDGPQRARSILTEHPLMLSVARDAGTRAGGPISVGLGLQLLKRRRARLSAARMRTYSSRGFWPMPLLSRAARGRSVYAGGRHMSRGLWPMALVRTTPRARSVIAGGDLPLSRRLGWSPVA